MNIFFKDYINKKKKEKNLEYKDSICYYIILRRINLYLEKSKMIKNLDNYFILEEMDNNNNTNTNNSNNSNNINNNNLDLKNINESENEFPNKIKKYFNNLFK